MVISVATAPVGFWMTKPGLLEGCHSEAFQSDSIGRDRHSADVSNGDRERTEVSRGHSSVFAREQRRTKGRTQQYREER